jgi:hypothetical protein
MFCTAIRSAGLAAVAALLLAAPTTANACWPYGGFNGYGYGVWNNASFYNGGIYASPLPYFAQFPPVYYSHQITARHYGASPYAWSAGQEPITFVPQPEPRSVAMPLMIDNPFVGGAKPAAAAQAGATENPFVASSR